MILKRMATLASLLVILGSGGLASAQTEIFSDNFNDNHRNTGMWFVPGWSSGKFKENSERLRFFSNPAYTSAPLNQMGGWISLFTRTYNKGDTLDMTCKVRAPHRIPSNPGGAISNAYEVGMGLFQSVTNSNFIEFTVRDSQSNREFGIFYYSESLGYTREYTTYPAPTNLTIFQLRMSYSCATDLINFYWRDPKSNVWEQVRPAIPMTDLFGVFKVKRMAPYTIAYTENITVPPEWNVWLDNFTATQVNQPKP